MSSFVNALKSYRSALIAAVPELPKEHQPLFTHLIESVNDIEGRFRETSDPATCRILVEGEWQILGAHIFTGPRVDEARTAYQVLRDAVRPVSK